MEHQKLNALFLLDDLLHCCWVEEFNIFLSFADPVSKVPISYSEYLPIDVHPLFVNMDNFNPPPQAWEPSRQKKGDLSVLLLQALGVLDN